MGETASTPALGPPLPRPGPCHARPLGGRAGALADDSGQAMLEAALVLPAMIFLILVMLQLTMVQHARIMTDYAAFCAARAGIIYNADRRAMERAATVALLPTMGRTDSLDRLGRVAQRAEPGGIEFGQRAAFGLPVVHVDLLNPRPDHFSTLLSRHLGGAEIDFDDVRPAAAEANLLEIRIRYFYRMQIPFANQILQNMFFAQVLGTLQTWQGMNALMPEQRGGGSPQQQAVAMFAGRGLGTDASDVATQHAAGLVRANRGRFYFFPLEATYTMRMQSNAFLRNVQ